MAHRQVLAHEKLDELAVLRVDVVLPAEQADLARTQFGVVAAAALGDVMEERSDVQHVGLVPSGGQLRAERVFVRVLCDEEAPHVAQHHQDVLVHRVHMEQVVLHLPHDAAEHPEVAAEHRGLVHQPHRVGDAAGLHQHGAEGGTVDGVAAELAVHHPARVVQRAQRARRQAPDADHLLVQQEGFQDGVGIAQVEVVAGDLQHAGFLEEALVDRPRRVGAGVEPLLDVEQQDLVELRDGLRGPVEALHQLLAGTGDDPALVVAEVVVAEGLGHAGLQVEDEPVLAAPGQHVQPCPDERKDGLVALDLARLQRRGQALAGQLVPAAAQARGPGHPQDDLQVSQAAGRLLAVGFQRIGRVLELVVALAHLQRLGHEEGARVQRCVEALAELCVQPPVARDGARFQQGGLHRHVPGGHGQAFLQGAHAGADLQARIPAAADEGFHLALQLRVALQCDAIRHQHQHVDVGVREELAAPEAAHGHQREALREARLRPELAQGVVGQAREFLQQRADAARGGAAGPKAREQFFLACAVAVAQHLHRVQRAVFQGAAPAHSLTKSGGGGLPAESVSTS